MLEIEALTKAYGKKRAVDSLTLSIKPGEICAFIGHNGAGKTTTIKSVCGIIQFDAGEIRIDGISMKEDPLACKARIAYIPDNPDIYEFLSGIKYLNFIADVYGIPASQRQERIRKYADLFELTSDLAQPVSAYSHGMKQKLALSCALIHKPTVLFLDEPTTGVDPVSRKEFWDMLMKLKAQGITILVSTPYMDEATRCDRIALIMNGEFMQVDTPQNIIAGYSETLWSVQSNQMKQLMKDLHKNPSVKSTFSFGDAFHITVENPFTFEELKAFLENEGHTEIEIQSIQPTVEDCFMLLSKNRNNGK